MNIRVRPGYFGCVVMQLSLPDVYKYCENRYISYFILLSMNDILHQIMGPELKSRLVGRLFKPDGKAKYV